MNTYRNKKKIYNRIMTFRNNILIKKVVLKVFF